MVANIVNSTNGPKVLVEKLLQDQLFNGSVTFQTNLDYKTGAMLEKKHTLTVPFLFTSNFGFSLGNTWSQLIPKEATEFLDKMIGFASMLNTGQEEGKTTFHNVSIVSKAMSSLSWKGSDIPEFKVDMIFVATNRDYNPIDFIKQLAMTCLPTRLSSYKNDTTQKIKGGIKDNQFVQDMIGKLNNLSELLGGGAQKVVDMIAAAGLMSPLQYKAIIDYEHDEAITDGTVVLRMGRWFLADKLVVKSLSGIEFSKETIAPPSFHVSKSQKLYDVGGVFNDTNLNKWGFPLYAKCSMTLVPVTPITYEDFCKYFIKPTFSQDQDSKARSLTEQNIQAYNTANSSKAPTNPNNTGSV